MKFSRYLVRQERWTTVTPSNPKNGEHTNNSLLTQVEPCLREMESAASFIRYVETKCRKVEEEENDDFLYGNLVLATGAC